VAPSILSQTTPAAATRHFRGTIHATLWPTRSLVGSARWFDELYIWTQGATVSTTQRANIQLNSLRDAFEWLAYDLVEQVGVTISFGTVERMMDPLTALFERNATLAHRTHVLFRGAPQRLRSRYRLRAFASALRGLNYPVGYRISAPRVSMEIAGIDLVEPSFAKVLATTAPREEAWGDLALELRALGLDLGSTIVGGIEVPPQAHLASRAGFALGQGRAIRQPYPPPSSPTTTAAS
jgi:hypothetical protein